MIKALNIDKLTPKVIEARKNMIDICGEIPLEIVLPECCYYEKVF